MLTVISPAKRLDWTERETEMTEPRFQPDAEVLARVARGLSTDELTKLMGISHDLAKLNAERFARFGEGDRRPAALAFAGDTYAGLEAASLDADAMRYAQERLRILSGLYGLLRPLDGIEAYRLEMGSRLKTDRGRSLYDWWGDRIARTLNEEARAVGARTLVNCASVEYFSAVDAKALDLDVVTPVFLEEKSDGPRIVSFFAKKARGAMARFIVEKRLDAPEQILDFDTGGYAHAPGLSEPGKPAFLRSAAAEQAA
ncbi:peroxide stress protein YaaA [Roseibacterium sp. SDUM158017]|uniref:peroxide stress protein YaaA n=1 Tax=Roseicyclus salinarum TaxID=3036773 RepID=UPI0024158126|nr:peroxide stress protein YaaA [Roseibacterium sp. SDUM158017]MDG4648970.1 peroxide stress protein YaaA [Roseibacterium sp. SDUM158017]